MIHFWGFSYRNPHHVQIVHKSYTHTKIIYHTQPTKIFARLIVGFFIKTGSIVYIGNTNCTLIFVAKNSSQHKYIVAAKTTDLLKY